jgi:hypothetical protein
MKPSAAFLAALLAALLAGCKDPQKPGVFQNQNPG